MVRHDWLGIQPVSSFPSGSTLPSLDVGQSLGLLMKQHEDAFAQPNVPGAPEVSYDDGALLECEEASVHPGEEEVVRVELILQVHVWETIKRTLPPYTMSYHACYTKTRC